MPARIPIIPTIHRATVVALSICLAATSPATAQQADTARRVAIITGFQTPESVRYDAEQDVFFISNIVGGPSMRDGAGYISRVPWNPAAMEMRFIEGGRNGVILNAPKGMAIAGDTLWVADIDAVRGFHRRTGAPLATVDLSPHGAVFLNDVVRGTDGALYVTDTGIVIDAQGGTTHPGPDRIFRIHAGQVTVAAHGEALALPNGIAVAADGGFLIAPAGGPAIAAWNPGDAPRPIAQGPGGYDGIEVLPDGRILVTSWADSAVHEVRDGALHPLIRGVPGPADLGVDARRGIVAIPLFTENRVELWALPERRE